MQTQDKVNDEPKHTCSLCRIVNIDVIIQKSRENARKYSWIKPIDTLRKKDYKRTKDQKPYSAFGYQFQRSCRLGLLSRRRANSPGHSMPSYHEILTIPYKNTINTK